MNKWRINWANFSGQNPKLYKCGYCGSDIASQIGIGSSSTGDSIGYIYLCHVCNAPTVFDPYGNQIPGPLIGREINEISDPLVKEMYLESRKCFSTNSYTSSVMICRKLIMNLAVSKGAKTNLNFNEYVEYLGNNGYVPPDGKEWINHIRIKGNEANHEIAIMKKEDAEDIIKFLEMLLVFIYEFPARMRELKPKI